MSEQTSQVRQYSSLIIAGTRTFMDGSLFSEEDRAQEVASIINEKSLSPDEIVSGTARGADAAGEAFANAVDLPVAEFPADWDGEHGDRAGLARNYEMAQYADGLLAIWDGSSTGTADMIAQARAQLGDENVHVHMYTDGDVESLPEPNDRTDEFAAGCEVDNKQSDDDTSSSRGTDDLQDIVQVGGVRAYRLRRAGYNSVFEVAEASESDLESIISIGPVRSSQIKAGAQAIVEDVEDQVGNEEHRVAVVSGEGTLDEIDSAKAHDLIDGALVEANVTLDEWTRIGLVGGDEMCGDVIRNWYKKQTMLGNEQMRMMEFHTPWEKYAYFLWDEWGYDEQPDIERPSLKTDIPFDANKFDDIEAWMAPAERTADMVRWADEVVIVSDGEYADSFRNKCETWGVECTTVYNIAVQGRDDMTIEKFEEQEHETETYEPDESETIMGGEARWGSSDDLSSDVWHDGPMDTLDGREEETQTGGSGVGSSDDKYY